MPCRFIDDEVYNQSSEQEKKTFIKKDPDSNIKDWIQQDDVIQAIEYIMFNEYKTYRPLPDEFKFNKNSNNGVVSAESRLFEIFRILPEREDEYITNSTIEKKLAENHISMSLLKAIKMLKANGAVPYRSSTSRGLRCIEYLGD